MASGPDTRRAAFVQRDPAYGWVLVGAGALSMAYQAGLVGGRAVFVAAIPDADGWSRASASAAVSALSLGSGLWAPLVGHAVQQWGARRTMSVAALVLGAGLVVASLARGPLELGLVLLVLVAPGSMGVGSLANFAAIQAWFATRRGMALSLADSGSSLGLMLLVPLTQVLVEQLGWRGAFLALGLAGLLLAPFHWAIQRPPPGALGDVGRATGSRPVAREQRGAADPASVAAASDAPVSSSLWSLVRSRHFVVLTVGLSGIWLAQQIVMVHQAAYLADHGYDAVSIVTAFALVGLTGLPGRPLFGWLSDRIGTVRSFGILTVGLVSGIGALVLAGDGRIVPALWVYGIALGASLGVGTLLFARLISTLFGQRRFGTVMGLGYFFGSAVGAAGATLAGLARDVTGTYVPSFGVAALAALLSFACVWLLDRARSRGQ